jgi:hypothetical protein
MNKNKVYGRRVLLAKENLKMKDYLTKNSIAAATSVTPRDTLHKLTLYAFMTDKGKLPLHSLSKRPKNFDEVRGEGSEDEAGVVVVGGTV